MALLPIQRHLVINDRETLRKIFLQSGSCFRNRPGPFLDVVPIKDSLLFQKDAHWKRVRQALQPVFGANQVTAAAITQTISDCTERLIRAFETHGRRQEDGSFLVPFYPRMQATSLDVIARTALNMEEDVHNEKNEVLRAVKEYFSDAMNVAVNASTLFPFLRPVMTFINDYLTAGAMTDLAVSLSISASPPDLPRHACLGQAFEESDPRSRESLQQKGRDASLFREDFHERLVAVLVFGNLE